MRCSGNGGGTRPFGQAAAVTTPRDHGLPGRTRPTFMVLLTSLNRPCGGHVLTPTRNCLPKENMRRLYQFLILLRLCTVSQAADTNSSGQWTSLFNGKDLSGW